VKADHRIGGTRAGSSPAAGPRARTHDAWKTSPANGADIGLSDRLQAVILCGGIGARLWPLSSPGRPKQFAPLLGSTSLFRLALRRAAALCGDRVLCAASEQHLGAVEQALAEERLPARILAEPCPRNTAPALACAALLVSETRPDALLISLPADHHIPNVDAFAALVEGALPTADEGWLVVFGVKPDAADPAYGYIAPGDPLAGLSARRADRFVEKPTAERARELVASGHLWNSGILLTRADSLIEAISERAPDVLAACRSAIQAGRREGHRVRLQAAELKDCPSISIDHAVLERHERVAVMPFPGAWSDLGSWEALARHAGAPAGTNRFCGDVRLVDCDNVFVHSESRPIAAVGIEDLIVADLPHALFIAHRSAAHRVRELVPRAEMGECAGTPARWRLAKPWGRIECLDHDRHSCIARLTLRPGATVSLRRTACDHEHWVVANGAAALTVGKRVRRLERAGAGAVPKGEPRALRNSGAAPFELVVVRASARDSLDHDFLSREAEPLLEVGSAASAHVESDVRSVGLSRGPISAS
jgi:mannose-1-phosphate guanylyltransferase/mannose-6-phosphate isomerase